VGRRRSFLEKFSGLLNTSLHRGEFIGLDVLRAIQPLLLCFGECLA